jgi:hypothetical protein
MLVHSHQVFTQIVFPVQSEHPWPVVYFLVGFQAGQLVGLYLHVRPEQVKIVGFCVF